MAIISATSSTLTRPVEVKIPDAAAAMNHDPFRRPLDPFFSVIIPALNEADNLPVLHERLVHLMQRLGISRYELLVIDDGSTDRTLDVLRHLAANDDRLRYISFSRNFGHQPAVRAGIDHARGDCVAAMDADLQHPPALLEDMLLKWRDGYDIITAVRQNPSRPSLIGRATTAGFYRVVNMLGEHRLEPGAADFYLLDRSVVDTLKALPETDVFFRGLLPWLGFKTIRLPYTIDKRLHGSSKYNPRRQIDLALTGVLATSIQPLRLAIFFAVIVAALTLAHAAYALIAYFMGKAVPGWTTIVIVISTLGAMNLLVLGIIGEYLGRVLKETRRRPTYVIRTTNTNPENT